MAHGDDMSKFSRSGRAGGCRSSAPARRSSRPGHRPSDEYHPTLSRNRQTLWFVRRIPRRGDFYYIDTRALDLR